MQLSHSKRRWHPLWSTLQEITMHWQKKKESLYTSLWIFCTASDATLLYCTVCLQEVKASGEKRNRKDKSGRVMVLHWDEMKLFLPWRHFSEGFLSSTDADPSFPLFFFFWNQWNNTTFLSWGGRRDRNPIIIMAGPHGNSLTLSNHSLHSVDPNYFRPPITFP